MGKVTTSLPIICKINQDDNDESDYIPDDQEEEETMLTLIAASQPAQDSKELVRLVAEKGGQN